ncbi:general secretion pathway protein C [Vibrio sinaloensis DSM 21326]|uniref:General secretion pathway protein C n=1 Tax=Vibrio sinaloensis DSM 21326 TaxID=945550 RepID=E8M4Z4_PHOS4|nr:type II secretion system protein GspC [Vibrio sinaloensis]EGA70845.1 general secretion pathway protein C [Vibrio sinaloensis DSM 21326]
MKQQGVSALYKLGESVKEISVQKRISFTLMALLLAMSAWILGQLVWQPLVTERVTPWKPVVSASSKTQSNQSINLSELQNSHLFGEYQEQPQVVTKPKVEDAPKSRLNVVLVGVVTSTNSDKSLAVIANRGRQATYGIGEVIEGTRAKLYQVQTDRVIIDNAGRNETVMLEGLKYTKPVANNTPAPASSSKVQVSESKIEQIRQEIRKDAKQIFQYVRMSQVKRDGDVMGYRLTPGKDKALFDSVGLKAGDVATQINGLDLKDSAAMGEIFQSLSQLTELTLTVERDGQPYEIYIELN